MIINIVRSDTCPEENPELYVKIDREAIQNPNLS